MFTAPLLLLSGTEGDPPYIAGVFCAALILLMQAGFALNEAGFTRAKNAANIMLRSIANLSLGGLAFWAVGFGLMFGASNGITGWSWFPVSPDLDAGGARVSILWMQQALCAVTAGAIVFGATAERMRFGASAACSVAMALLIYPVAGHWAWGNVLLPGNADSGSWLARRGFIDFAGSAVVHCVGGFGALAAAMAIGPRLGKFAKDGSTRLIAGHNLTLSSLGVMLVFFGWLGFTCAPAALAPGPVVVRVAMNTMIAGFAGATGAMLTGWVRFGKPDISMTLNGTLAGLVAISASCATVYPSFAMVIGAGAGVVVVYSVLALDRARVDDPVGAISVHGVCGVFGTLAAGALNTAMFDGSGYDVLERTATQALGLAAIAVWSFGTVFALLKAMGVLVGVRVSAEDEVAGLDLAEHGATAYAGSLEFPASATASSPSWHSTYSSRSVAVTPTVSMSTPDPSSLS